ncbi:MAG: RNA 2',3'-cyclic phosphodiesterase [Christensenellales bacterium]|jgi:2'-5' RNA ligase
MRLFIAVELPKAVRNEVGAALKELKMLSSGGRFVQENNLHITLHFIGESNDLAGAVKAMQSAVRGIRPFELRPVGFSSFERSGSRTAFIEVGGNTGELAILHESLQTALADNGFAREYRRFVPHITLGRSVEFDELVYAQLQETEFKTSFTASEITLFESVKEKGKLVYNPLHREKL